MSRPAAPARTEPNIQTGPRLFLASKSATRHTLLNSAGIAFEGITAEIDERQVENALDSQFHGPSANWPSFLAEQLAIAKAAAAKPALAGDIVLGADQILALDGEVLHKPENPDDIRARLERLAGRTHTLLSGFALVRDGKPLFSGVATARLTMRPRNDSEIARIMALEGPALLQSVGAYRLEGPAIALFSTIEGDYFTILGLPLLDLLPALREYVPNAFIRAETAST